MPPHTMTPYVTPHIYHKHYAQAFDNETVSKRMSRRRSHLYFLS
jgi:phosphoenolpyruvate carboxykinase (ATP)